VHNVLSQLRTAKGWTQADLARALDVSRQTVISLEKGRYDPSLPLAFKIAALFQCTIEDVFQPNGEA
jgi:putative transcriptional regulator